MMNNIDIAESKMLYLVNALHMQRVLSDYYAVMFDWCWTEGLIYGPNCKPQWGSYQIKALQTPLNKQNLTYGLLHH